jgi:lysophospholipase L1-like esterase
MKKDPYFLASVALNVVLVAYIYFTRSSPEPLPQKTTVSQEGNNTTDSILFIGNSIMANCNWNELLQNKYIVNDGVGGITSEEILLRLTSFLKNNPRKVFFEMGLNDIHRNSRLQEIINNFYNILKATRLKSPLTKIYFFSVLPVEEKVDGQDVPVNEKIDQLNKNTELLCKRYNAIYMDLNPLLKDGQGQLQHECSLDGSHLTLLGYEKLKDKINSFIND